MDLANINTSIFKEPRGMIRVIQLIFAILAFATTSGFDTQTTMSIACPGGYRSEINYVVEYPFKFESQTVTERFNCTKDVPRYVQKFPMEFASSAQFFVATGVLSFLYTIGSLFFYLFYSKHYETNPLLPVMDLVATAILTLFWLAGSCAWAAGVSDIKYYTNPSYLATLINICKDPDSVCDTQNPGKWASLNISLIFGFANIFIWGMGNWFVFKETTFHPKPPLDPMSGGPIPSQFGQPQQQPFQTQQPQFPPQQPPVQQTNTSNPFQQQFTAQY